MAVPRGGLVWGSAYIAMDKRATSGRRGLVFERGCSQMVERNMEILLRFMAMLTIAILVVVVGFIAKEAFLPTPVTGGLQSDVSFSLISLVVDWLLVSFCAILMAFPLGLLTALYITEIASQPVAGALTAIFGVLAAIPSIIIGFIGVVIAITRWGSDLPLSRIPMVGGVALLLAVATFPSLVCSLLDRFSLVPPSFKAASYALGASRWQTIRRTILPMVSPGTAAAGLMGFRRVLGETVIVLLISHGISQSAGTTRPLATIPVAMAYKAEIAAPGTSQYQTIFALGLILLATAYGLNHLAQRLMRLQGGEWE